MNWTAIGLGADLRVAMAMPVRLAGTDLAVWRSASGAVHAWGDRCPHRGMRLSHGFVRGETLACIYHGWQYGADGGCVAIPAHPALSPPKTICAQAYPCAEAGGLLWTTLGAAAGEPPRLANVSPVRSLLLDTPADAVRRYFDVPGGPETGVIDVTGPHPVTLALQPVDEARCAVHALTDAAPHRVAVSRWLEDLRATLERIAA